MDTDENVVAMKREAKLTPLEQEYMMAKDENEALLKVVTQKVGPVPPLAIIASRLEALIEALCGDESQESRLRFELLYERILYRDVIEPNLGEAPRPTPKLVVPPSGLVVPK